MSPGVWDLALTADWMTQAHIGLTGRVALAAGGQLLASAGEGGIVRVWDAENGRCQATLVGHDEHRSSRWERWNRRAMPRP